MVIINMKLMNFLCEINRLTNGRYYVAFDNDSNDVIFVESKTGNYERVLYTLCAKYYDNPAGFLSEVL